MKRVVLLLIGFVTTVQLFAQLSLGVQGTTNLSDASIDVPDFASFSKKARVLPGGGIVADIAVNPSFTVRTGVNFLQNGITLKTTLPGVGDGQADEMSLKASVNLSYVQVPLNVLFTTKGKVQLFAGGGPYVSFAARGRSKLETTYKFSDGSVSVEKEETNVFKKDENGQAAFKRWDYGIGVLAGVKLPGNLFANVGYQFSLANINDGDDSKYRNRGLQLTVGYYLWRK